MTDKKGFLLYLDMWPQLSKLKDEELGNVFRNVFRYQNGEDLEHNDRLTELVFEGIRSTLDRDGKTWADERKRRAEAGKLGGLAKASNSSNATKNLALVRKAKQRLANVPDRVNVTETVIVTETEKENTDLIPLESNGASAHIPKKENVTFFEASIEDILLAFDFESFEQKEKVRREIEKFRDYWTEKNSTGTKMRWQMEKTFEVKKRLQTWFRNVRGFTSPGFVKPDRAGENHNLFGQ